MVLFYYFTIYIKMYKTIYNQYRHSFPNLGTSREHPHRKIWLFWWMCKFALYWLEDCITGMALKSCSEILGLLPEHMCYL